MANYRTLLVVTYGRSGSTLLMGLLNSIDGYLIRGENYNCFRGFYDATLALRRTTKMNKIGSNTREPWFGATEYDPDQFVRELGGAARRLLIAGKMPEADVNCVGFKEIRYLQMYERAGAERLTDYLDFLEKLFEGSAVIFNTRNPADVARSGWWRKADPEKLKASIESFEEVMLNFGRSRQNFYHIRYEEVVARGPGLKGLFDFLGEPYDALNVEAVLNARHSTKNEELPA